MGEDAINKEKGIEFLKLVFKEIGLSEYDNLLSTQNSIELLEKIYRNQGLYVEAVKTISKKECILGKTCPFCQFPIKQESEVVVCSACKIPHHNECWVENKGCTTFGCSGKSFQVLSGSGFNISSLKQENVWVANTSFDMVQVGEPGVTYTVPTGRDDLDTAHKAQVAGGYYLATIPVTYELWYEVRQWAEANRYHFQNQGMEGSVSGGGEWPDYNNIGKPPTAARNEPVTMVNWRDCIAWINAFSEKQGLEPVYSNSTGGVIKDSRDRNAKVVDAALQAGNNGYRLPTSMEWEMAARWNNDTTSVDGFIKSGGRRWTPGNYASGATADYENVAITRAVAWCKGNPDSNQVFKTQEVGQKKANTLGFYDMSGNVWEWCFDWYPDHCGLFRVLRGGSWASGGGYLSVGFVSSQSPLLAYDHNGFRLARNL